MNQPMAPRDIELLLESGAPPESIRPDHTLDVDILRAAGWTVTDEHISPPDTPEFRAIAERSARRALDDPRTIRGFQ